MPPERLSIPVRGVANTVPPRQQPSDFTRPVRSRNWRIDPQTGRPVRRPPLRKAFEVQMGQGRPVQALAVVSRASTFTGFAHGTVTDLESWESRPAGTLAGNAWLLDKNWAMERDRYENVQASGPYGDNGPATNTISRVRFSPDGALVAFCTSFTDSVLSRVVSRITVVRADADFGASQPYWTKRIDLTADTRVHDLCWSPDGTYLFAAVNHLLYVLKGDSGEALYTDDMDGWTGGTNKGKCAALAVGTLAGVTSLYVGFNGHADAGTCAGGASISADHYGSMFRAGVAKYTVSTANIYAPLSMQTFGGSVAAGSTFFESAHSYWRVSERAGDVPYGCYVTGLAVAPDGTVYLGRTNQGGGPNNTFEPDGNVPYVTVLKIATSGALVWAKDTDSIKAANFGGFANDFDVGGTDYAAQVFTVVPSVIVVRADPSAGVNNRSVYAAGRRNAAATTGFNVYRLAQENGGRHWRQNLSGTVRDLCIDPLDNSPIAATDRNADWTGNGGASDLQHLFKLARYDGTVTRKYDLATANLDALAVDVDETTGRLALGSEKR